MEFKITDSANVSFSDKALRVIKVYWWSIFENLIPLFSDHFVHLVSWPLVSLSALGVFFTPRPLRAWLVTLTASFVLLYNFHPTRGYPQYGARYWYPIITSIFLAISFPFYHWAKRLPTICTVVITGILMVNQLRDFDTFLKRKSAMFTYRMKIIQKIEHSCNLNSVVILPQKFGDLRRNPFLRGPRYYFTNESSAQAFKNHLSSDFSICDLRNVRF
jgi:hypothetical protein